MISFWFKILKVYFIGYLHLIAFVLTFVLLEQIWNLQTTEFNNNPYISIFMGITVAFIILPLGFGLVVIFLNKFIEEKGLI